MVRLRAPRESTVQNEIRQKREQKKVRKKKSSNLKWKANIFVLSISLHLYISCVYVYAKCDTLWTICSTEKWNWHSLKCYFQGIDFISHSIFISTIRIYGPNENETYLLPCIFMIFDNYISDVNSSSFLLWKNHEKKTTFYYTIIDRGQKIVCDLKSCPCK